MIYTHDFLEEIDGYICYHNNHTNIGRFEKSKTFSRIITNGMFTCQKCAENVYEFTKHESQIPGNDIWWFMSLEIEETPRCDAYGISIMYNTNTKQYVFVQFGDKTNVYIMYDNDWSDRQHNCILTTEHQKLFDKLVNYDLQKMTKST